MSVETRERKRARDRARVLTAEQREHKRAKDRERRARIAAEGPGEPYMAASVAPPHSSASLAEGATRPAKVEVGPLAAALALAGAALIGGALLWS